MGKPVTLTLQDLNVFPRSYNSAREKLKSLSQDLVQKVERQSFPLAGITDIDTESLATDTLWIGSPTAENVVILISATHGIEGFVGAAVQIDYLQQLRQNAPPPSGTAILIIFALNPFGFAQYRRCDEMGIDLNRNFINFSQPLPANPGYVELQQAIYCEDRLQRNAMFEQFQEQEGQTAFEIAISGGQYTDQHGPFYGGQQPAHGNRVINQVIEDYRLNHRHLAVIDIHSGLGPYSHGELINDHPLNSPGFHVTNRWYGPSVTAPASGDSSSVKKAGLLDYRWHELMAERGSFITLEFGSYRTQAMFEVILENHRSWKLADPEAINASAIAMQEHFCPRDNYWRELVLIKGRQVIQQAISGLKNE